MPDLVSKIVSDPEWKTFTGKEQRLLLRSTLERDPEWKSFEPHEQEQLTHATWDKYAPESSVTSTATAQIGKTPYKWGGEDLNKGADCSGFTCRIYEKAGKKLPRTAREQYKVGTPVQSLADLQPGDQIFFKGTQKDLGPDDASHTGIYLGDGRFVHASSAKGNVVEDDLNKAYWKKKWLGAKRHVTTPGGNMPIVNSAVEEAMVAVRQKAASKTALASNIERLAAEQGITPEQARKFGTDKAIRRAKGEGVGQFEGLPADYKTPVGGDPYGIDRQLASKVGLDAQIKTFRDKLPMVGKGSSFILDALAGQEGTMDQLVQDKSPLGMVASTLAGGLDPTQYIAGGALGGIVGGVAKSAGVPVKLAHLGTAAAFGAPAVAGGIHEAREGNIAGGATEAALGIGALLLPGLIGKRQTKAMSAKLDALQNGESLSLTKAGADKIVSVLDPKKLQAAGVDVSVTDAGKGKVNVQIVSTQQGPAPTTAPTQKPSFIGTPTDAVGGIVPPTEPAPVQPPIAKTRAPRKKPAPAAEPVVTPETVVAKPVPESVAAPKNTKEYEFTDKTGASHDVQVTNNLDSDGDGLIVSSIKGMKSKDGTPASVRVKVSGKNAWVDTSFIPEENRGVGLGSELYRKAIQEAFDRGATTVTSSRSNTADAERIYESLKKHFDVTDNRAVVNTVDGMFKRKFEIRPKPVATALEPTGVTAGTKLHKPDTDTYQTVLKVEDGVAHVKASTGTVVKMPVEQLNGLIDKGKYNVVPAKGAKPKSLDQALKDLPKDANIGLDPRPYVEVMKAWGRENVKPTWDKFKEWARQNEFLNPGDEAVMDEKLRKHADAIFANGGFKPSTREARATTPMPIIPKGATQDEEAIPGQSPQGQAKQNADAATSPIKEGNAQAKPVQEVESARTDNWISAARNDVNAIRRQEGKPELTPTEVQHWQDNLADARARGIPERAESIAAEINKKPRQIDAAEVLGLQERRNQLVNARNKLDAEIDAALGAKDTAKAKALALQSEQMTQSIDSIENAQNIAGGEVARALSAMNAEANRLDFDKIRRRRLLSSPDKPLTVAETATAKALDNKLRESESRLKEVQAELQKEVEPNVQRELDRIVDAERSASSKRKDRIADLDTEIASLESAIEARRKKPGQIQRGGRQSGAVEVDPELLRLSIKLFNAKAKRTVNKSIDLAHEVWQKTVADAMPFREFADTISGYNKVRTAATEETQNVQAAKRALRLVSQIEDVKAGKDPRKFQGYQKTDEIVRLEAELNAALKSAGMRITKPLTDEQLLSAAKTRMAQQVLDWEKAQQTLKAPTRTRRYYELDAEAQLLKKTLRDTRIKAEHLIAKNNPVHRAKLVLQETASIFTTVFAGADISMVGRQGLPLAARNPELFVNAVKTMGKGMWTKDAYANAITRITDSPNIRNGLYERMGGHLSHDMVGAEKNEFSPSAIISKLPGYLQGDRAAILMVDAERVAFFDKNVERLKKMGITPEKDPKAYKAIADLGNMATGRKRVDLGVATSVVQSVLFSLKFQASRALLLNPAYYATLPKGARRIAIENAAAYAGLIAGVGLALNTAAKRTGADIGMESHPGSADFGQVRIGSRRFDLAAGFRPWVNMIWRIGTGTTKSTRTGTVENLKIGPVPDMEGKNSLEARGGVAARFVRSKLNPLAGAVVDVATGRNFKGEKTDVKQTAKELATPYPGWARTVVDNWKKDPIWAAAMGAAEMAGVGAADYSK